VKLIFVVISVTLEIWAVSLIYCLNMVFGGWGAVLEFELRNLHLLGRCSIT
jgi:hypothetical protein